MDSREVDRLAKIIWDYHHINQPLEKADCILVLGSRDLRVAEYATQLFIDGYAPLVIFSGWMSPFAQKHWQEPEGDKFAKIAIEKGIPEDRILIENQSKNTGENILFTKRLLAEKNLPCKKFLVVVKPYQERRAYATFKKQWPESIIITASPSISFENYTNEYISRNDLITKMIGDLQRIKLYPEKGFQIYQEIPQEVWDAYLALVKAGYNQDLL